jgi:hypothetical protein
MLKDLFTEYLKTNDLQHIDALHAKTYSIKLKCIISKNLDALILSIAEYKSFVAVLRERPTNEYDLEFIKKLLIIIFNSAFLYYIELENDQNYQSEFIKEHFTATIKNTYDVFCEQYLDQNEEILVEFEDADYCTFNYNGAKLNKILNEIVSRIEFADNYHYKNKDLLLPILKEILKHSTLGFFIGVLKHSNIFEL